MKTFYTKGELTQLYGVSIRELNELLMKHGIVERKQTPKGVKVFRGYRTKYTLGISEKGKQFVVKLSGTWTEGVYRFDHEKIKDLFSEK